MEAALGHEGQETQGLQGHRLTAGVGTGDDQGVKVFPQIQVVAHGGLGVQQGVAGFFQLDVVPQHRLHAPHVGGQLGPGEDDVQGNEGAVVVLDALPEPGTVGRQLRQNALDLLLLLHLQLSQFIVGVDHSHWLDEEGTAGAGHVVDQAGNLVFVLALHRHHVAAAPHGDDGLLQILGLVGGDEAVEHVPHLPRRRPDVAADVRQLGGGGVGNFILAENGAADFLLQKAVGGQAVEIAVQHSLFRALPHSVLPHIAGAAQHLGDVQQLPGVQCAAPVRPLQGSGHRAHPGKGGGAVLDQHLKGGRGLLLQPGHVGHHRLRSHLAAGLLALLGHRLVGQHGQHPRQFQGLYGFFK